MTTSVMIIDEPAWVRYYAGGALRFESQARFESPRGVRVRWMEHEGPHSVENIDERRYHAIRIELLTRSVSTMGSGLASAAWRRARQAVSGGHSSWEALLEEVPLTRHLSASAGLVTELTGDDNCRVVPRGVL
ncbi:MAG: hypothetical protein ACRDNO_17775 [Trebonia sp.]